MAFLFSLHPLHECLFLLISTCEEGGHLLLQLIYPQALTHQFALSTIHLCQEHVSIQAENSGYFRESA